MRHLLLSVVLLAVSIPFASAQDVVDDPEFASWSKYPEGTSITVKFRSRAAGMSTETTITTTLIENGEDHLVLETESLLKANGMEFAVPASKREVNKTLPLPEGAKKEDFSSDSPPNTLEEGTETLKIAGKNVKTRWYRFETEADGITRKSKLWKSDQLPGLMVKLQATTSGPVASKTTMEIVNFKRP